MSIVNNPLLNQGNITRDDLLTILSVGFRHKEYRFVRQAVLNWLAAYPGDIQFNYQYARSLFEDGKAIQAIPILDLICTIDPEFIAAHEMRMAAYSQTGKNISQEAGYIYALTGRKVTSAALPAWSLGYRKSQEAFDQEKLEDAELLIQQALITDTSIELPAVFHLQIVSALHDAQTLSNLANLYHMRWPDCLPVSLFLAAAEISIGNDTDAVALLHQCVAKDASGQVTKRIWGEDHPYRFLWPEEMTLKFNITVPPAIAAALGWNQLPFSVPGGQEISNITVEPVVEMPIAEPTQAEAETPVVTFEPEPAVSVDEVVIVATTEIEVSVEEPEISQEAEIILEPAAVPEHEIVTPEKQEESVGEADSKALPETFQDVRAELERIAGRLQISGLTRTDARYPVYVIVTTKKGLENQYGSQTSFILDELMKQSVEAIRKKPGWNAIQFYVDDPACTTTYGIKPAPFNDPWKIKLAIADLDKALAKRGEMIGALLIVGGPEVVPFHHLPNPTDDADAQIGSDNPYATVDDNYFVPEWPLGRLPGGTNRDAGILMQYLRKMITYHSEQSAQEPWWQRVSVFSPIFSGMRRVFAHSLGVNRPSFGYTAAVWSQASMDVFRPIGDTQSLLKSPPTKTGQLVGSGYLPAKLGYFNLHGVPDTAEWYGQPDFEEAKEFPEYPIAVSPQDVLNDGNAPMVIFSEACYGAYIEGKSDDQALSLKFLSSGTKALVGSTCVSYGSVSAPLIGADQLGLLFWKALKEGIPAGEALRNAKIQMAQEMTRRQGFLDGEDQKTLISFVLYGDPLVAISKSKKMEKNLQRERVKSPLMTVCQSSNENQTDENVDQLVMTQVKTIVEQYLPGLKDAKYSVAKQYASQVNDTAMGSKTTQALETERTVVTVSKEYQVANARKHFHYARLTIDNKGKVVKLAVSR